MRLATLLRLAFSGSLTDRMRAGLTVLASALAGLAILALGTVLNLAPTEQIFTDPNGAQTVHPTNWRYTTTLLNDTGLRPGVIAMVAAAIIPALVLIAQSARLGGPARDHRLAAMRIAGATPRQCRAIAAAEQGTSVALGALLAIAAYPLLHQMLHRPTMTGIRAGGYTDLRLELDIVGYSGPLLPLPTDTWPAWWSWLVVAAGLPVLAGVLSALALRRLIRSPLASARRVRRARPRLWPAWLIGIGLAIMAGCRVWIDRLQEANQPGEDLIPPYLTMSAGFAAICAGVPLCAAGIGYLGAKLALRYGKRPSTLIAARRVLADPYVGSRAVSALLVSIVLAAAVVSFRAYFAFSDQVAVDQGGGLGDPELTELVLNLLNGLTLMFVLFAAVGLLIALVDAALTRRRTEAALLASGTPNTILVRSRVMMVLLTAVPGVLLGLATGFAAPTLGLPPNQAPASMTLTCYGFGSSDVPNPVVPCTPENVELQKKANVRFNVRPNYSYVEYEHSGPWHNVYPPIPWDRLAASGSLALAAVALATVLSLLIGRRSGAATALRTT